MAGPASGSSVVVTTNNDPQLAQELAQRLADSLIDSMLTPPLEAGTIKWGFQRGRASPLVASGVQTPLANSIEFAMIGRKTLEQTWGENLARETASLGIDASGSDSINQSCGAIVGETRLATAWAGCCQRK